jgi:hypothetical protein
MLPHARTLLAAAALLVVAACGDDDDADDAADTETEATEAEEAAEGRRQGGELELEVGLLDHLEPHTAGLPTEYIIPQMAWRGLYSLTADNRLTDEQNQIADALPDVSGDGKTLTVRLREASPGQDIHALDLLAGSSRARKASHVELGDAVSLAAAVVSDVLDREARDAYRLRIGELRGEVQEAEDWNDPERASRAREEMDFITHELSSALGLGGRARQESSEPERARQSVTKAIKLAIARIAKHDGALGELLESSVQTGLFCRYEPGLAGGLTWRL